MWNKRRDEEPQRSFMPPGSQAPIAPSPAELKKEAIPVSNTPVGRFEPEPRGGSATIGKAVKINGQILSREDLYVDGDLEGTVEAPEHKLTIGPNGTVTATVKAREVVALGTIKGNVEAAERIEIRKEAKLVGDIRTARIVIEDGAFFKGSIDIVKPEPAKGAPPKAPQGPPVMTAPGTPLSAAAPDLKR